MRMSQLILITFLPQTAILGEMRRDVTLEYLFFVERNRCQHQNKIEKTLAQTRSTSSSRTELKLSLQRAPIWNLGVITQ